MFQELTVDLQCPPGERWRLTAAQSQQARELLSLYKTDLALSDDTFRLLGSAAKELVPSEYWLEMESLARSLNLLLHDVVLVNCYYDALKVVLMGCTAFAVDTGDEILHARNLDWWTENAALARHTTVCNFIGGVAGAFTTVGWPGFVGAFSGIAPGRFALTLNAVLSLDSPQPAVPVVFQLRTVFESARSFEEAADILTNAALPCDCLLLLTGTRSGEMIVIERTPLRSAVRTVTDGFICVTNDYQLLAANSGETSSELLATSCSRFQRVEALVRSARPRNDDDCFAYLRDPAVQMRITVQQMVFKARTGQYRIRIPV
jgi:acid ceramidase